MVKSTYSVFEKQIQHWLLSFVLIFSVFAFSGYNHHAHAAFNQPTQTELADARTSNPVFSYRSFTKKSNTDSCIPSIVFSYITSLPSINFRLIDQVLKSKNKSLKQKTLLFNILSINVQRRICYNAADEDDLSFFRSNIQ